MTDTSNVLFAPPSLKGLTHTVTHLVTEADVAFTQRSGGVKTLSTARLAEIVEHACISCLGDELKQGYSTAGSAVSMKHTAPMPVGSTISVKVAVMNCVRRQLTFSVEVFDHANALLKVASGTHQRVYIQTESFYNNLSDKVGERGIRLGLQGVSTHFVDVQHIASRNAFQGPRVVEALSTSSLMMWAEEAAIAALEEHLPQGTTTVGGETNLAHVAPTPKGMQVSCKATLVQISQTRKGGHKLLFDIEGEDRVQAVMKGTHMRFLVDRDSFEQRARGVAMPDGRRRGSWAGPLPMAEDMAARDGAGAAGAAAGDTDGPRSVGPAWAPKAYMPPLDALPEVGLPGQGGLGDAGGSSHFLL